MTENFVLISKDKAMEIADQAFENFKGDFTMLEKAIGALVIGRHLGWRVLWLIHDKKTLRKYEKILGIKFRDEIPDYGPRADKSRAYMLVQKVSNFWKAVSGEEPGIRTPLSSTDKER